MLMVAKANVQKFMEAHPAHSSILLSKSSIDDLSE